MYCSFSDNLGRSRVKPTNYNISIYDLEFGGAWSYQGTVSIDVNVNTSTKDVTLNSHYLKIHNAEIFFVEQGKSQWEAPVLSCCNEYALIWLLLALISSR